MQLKSFVRIAAYGTGEIVTQHFSHLMLAEGTMFEESYAAEVLCMQCRPVVPVIMLLRITVV